MTIEENLQTSIAWYETQFTDEEVERIKLEAIRQEKLYEVCLIEAYREKWSKVYQRGETK